MRLAFINTRIVAYISPYIPINDAEMIQNLSMAVQNGFLSKQTASDASIGTNRTTVISPSTDCWQRP